MATVLVHFDGRQVRNFPKIIPKGTEGMEMIFSFLNESHEKISLAGKTVNIKIRHLNNEGVNHQEVLEVLVPEIEGKCKFIIPKEFFSHGGLYEVLFEIVEEDYKQIIGGGIFGVK